MESDFASRLDALLHWDMSVDSQLHERVAVDRSRPWALVTLLIDLFQDVQIDAS